MKRIVVLGGSGFFGGAVVERLRSDGARPLVGSRRGGGDSRVDAEDPESIRRELRPGDVVVDAAGPFQDRSPALLDAAIGTGFDLIDISDSLEYALKVWSRRSEIAPAGIRVLTACSSVSAVTAALVRWSGIAKPVRVGVCLVPATRFTANAGAAASLLRSVGAPVRVRRGGRLVVRPGWRESRVFAMPAPLLSRRAYLCESADAVLLPEVWPSLADVDFFVDSNVPGLDAILRAAARWSGLRRSIDRLQSWGLAAARLAGAQTGGLAVDVEGEGERVRVALVAPRTGHYSAALPAAAAARALAETRFQESGLIPPDRHIDAQSLLDRFDALGIAVYRARSGDSWARISQSWTSSAPRSL
ncbi:MAG: hypothetical protein DMG07_23805 [Acidobacteria bacterium]|nr:MAG: hypothetical protein DMG07_23805 [Acidobacteriota bacterium]